MVSYGTHDDARRSSQKALVKLEGPDLPSSLLKKS